jgi:hypothetical protein
MSMPPSALALNRGGPLTEQEPVGKTDGNPAEQPTAAVEEEAPESGTAEAAPEEERAGDEEAAPEEESAEEERAGDEGAAPQEESAEVSEPVASVPAAVDAESESVAEGDPVAAGEQPLDAAEGDPVAAGEQPLDGAEGDPVAAGEQPAEAIADDEYEDDGEPEPDYEILPLAEADADEDHDDEDDDYRDDEDEQQAGFDKRPDVFSWIVTPVTTLFVGPGLAASIGLFVAERAKNYPRVCAPVRLANGCEETLLRMAAEHAVAFLFFWLLLWAMPWWRGLRAYRIGLAVVTALILIAVPLRLIASIQVGDTY